MSREICFDDHNCKICDRLFKNRRALGNHLARSHKLNLENYVLHFYFNDEVPTCLCGCGQPVLWKKLDYYYNDYVNGHNRAGFGSGNYVCDQHTVQKRNEAIKHAYETRGEEIRKRISGTLIDVFAEPKLKQKLSNARLKTWQSPEFREKMSDSQRKAWMRDYDKRYAAVFTEEFRRKIAERNMERDLKRTSKEEEVFCDRLALILAQEGYTLQRSVWRKVGNLSKCFDGFIPEIETFVEYDGKFWHGLDRQGDFTLIQLLNMAKDLYTNNHVRRSGMSLLRFSSETSLDSVLNWKEIQAKAYHIVERGTVLREGSFHLKDDDILISRDTLIKHNENHKFPTGKGKEFLEREFLPKIRDLLRNHVSYWDWFFPEGSTCTEALVELDQARIERGDMLSSTSRVATSYLQSRFHSFWKANDGPCNSFWRDEILDQVLRYRMGLNSSKDYVYQVEGQSVTTRETFPITLRDVRRGFVVQRRAVSLFKPTVARDIYMRYLRELKSDAARVWDPSGGFGGRLLGFASFLRMLDRHGEYICCEPASEIFEELSKLGIELENEVDGLDMTLLNCGSEQDLSSHLSDESCDLVFTSPPYFDLEKYFDEPGQCWRDYPTLELWKMKYVIPTVCTAFRVLKPGSRMVININHQNAQIFTDAARNAGFVLEETLLLGTGKDHFARKLKKTAKSEPILVFLKPLCKGS